MVGVKKNLKDLKDVLPEHKCELRERRRERASARERERRGREGGRAKETVTVSKGLDSGLPEKLARTLSPRCKP